MVQLYNSPIVKSRAVQIGQKCLDYSFANKYLPKHGENSFEKLIIWDLFFGQFQTNFDVYFFGQI